MLPNTSRCIHTANYKFKCAPVYQFPLWVLKWVLSNRVALGSRVAHPMGNVYLESLAGDDSSIPKIIL